MSIQQSTPLAQPPCAGENAIPATLRAIPQWVCWKYGSRPNRKGKLPKLPVNPCTGKLASVDAPATWSTFEQARHYAQRHGLGLGLVLTADLGIVVIDLDDAIAPDGNLTDFAQSVVDALDGWTEVSPSGHGLHIFAYGAIPASVRQAAIEIYSQDRYITLTGDRWPGTPAEIPHRADAINALYADVAGHPRPQPEATQQPTQPNNIADSDLVRRMFASRNGAKLKALWAGDWSDYASQSEGDQALCNALSFWTCRDPERIDSLFRQSGLYRDKWEQGSYRDSTIGKALAISEVYRGDYDQPVQYDGTVADILRFAYQVVNERVFVGRRAEYSRQCALGAVLIMQGRDSLQSPISGRHLAIVAGTGLSSAQIALLGNINRETGKRATTPETLTEWLLQKTETGDGVTANVYSLHHDIVQKYREITITYVVHARELTCDCNFAVSRIVANEMTDDSFSRNHFDKPKPHATPFNTDRMSNVDLLDRLVPLSSRLIYVLTGESHDTATLARLCCSPGGDVDTNDIAHAMTMITKLLRKAGQGPIFATKNGKISLTSCWTAILADARTKLERLAQNDWRLTSGATEDWKLKAFSPVGLAIIAYLESQLNKSACIAELAVFTDKHPATVSATIERMTTQLEQHTIGQAYDEANDVITPKRLRPVLLVGKDPHDGRKTLVTLPCDWKQRVNECRPHLCTDGINRRRNKFYARERLKRLEDMFKMGFIRDPERAEKAKQIIEGAQKVIDHGEIGRLNQLHQQIDQVKGVQNDGHSESNPPSQPAGRAGTSESANQRSKDHRPAHTSSSRSDRRIDPAQTRSIDRSPAVGTFSGVAP